LVANEFTLIGDTFRAPILRRRQLAYPIHPSLRLGCDLLFLGLILSCPSQENNSAQSADAGPVTPRRPATLSAKSALSQ
jgi:hypothetical protein